jgi:hypothetical protein
MSISPTSATLAVAGGFLGFGVMGLVLVSSHDKTQSILPQSSHPTAPAALTAISSKPDLAPEPPPKLAAKAAELPAIEAKLDADEVYQDIWTEPDRLQGFLTLVAMFLCIEDNFSTSDVATLKAKKKMAGEAAYSRRSCYAPARTLLPLCQS